MKKKVNVRTQMLSLCAAAALVLSGCGSGEKDESGAPQSGGDSNASAQSKSTSLDDVKVTGPVDKKPEVTFDAPLQIAKPAHKTIVRGKGPKLTKGKQVTANLTMVSGNTGQIQQSSYDEGKPAGFPMDTKNGINDVLFEALDGQPVGSRIAVAMQSTTQQGQSGQGEAPQTLVYIVDVVKQEDRPRP